MTFTFGSGRRIRYFEWLAQGRFHIWLAVSDHGRLRFSRTIHIGHCSYA